MRHPPARRSLSLPVAGTPPLTSLNAVAATGLGTTYNTQRAFSNWEVQISTTGGPTFSVQLQGSLDGQTLVNIGSPITATGLTNVTSNTPLTMVALNLTALSGGTLTGTIAGTESPAGAGGGGGGGGAVTQSTGAGAAAPWSVELSDGVAFYVGAKDTTLGTTNTEIGGLTETAPATDTASSGLNGRLQRVAQRLTSLIALLPAALVGGRLDVNIGAAPATVPVSAASLPLPTGAAADASIGTTNTEIGGLTETAPATDTASSGLNGRLQRVAQRLSSLIALFPAALVGGRLDVNLGAAPATITSNSTLQASTATAGNVGGLTKTVTTTLTRAATTTTYTAGDEMTDTGGTIRTISSIAVGTGKGGIITHCLLSCSSNGATKPTFNVYVYDTTSTPQTDNAAFTPADAEQDTCIGSFTLSTANAGDATANTGNFTMDSGQIHIPFTTAGAADLYFRVQVTNGYTPGANSDTYKFRWKAQLDA